MKNRAKCKLCSSIIESFHSTDYVVCECGEICVDGGDALRCSAKNWDNFLRVDDKGKEITVSVKDSLTNEESNNDNNSKHKPSKVELIQMLKEMNENIEKLPPYAMNNPINHYDFSSLLILLLALFKDDCSSDN